MGDLNNVGQRAGSHGARFLQGVTLTLLLVALPTPADAQDSSKPEELLVPDPRGDVAIASSPASLPLQAPPQPLTDGHDLLALRVYDENEELFTVEVEIADVHAALGVVQAGFIQSNELWVNFSLSASTAQYALRIEFVEPLPNEPPRLGIRPSPGQLCVYVGNGPCFAQHTMSWIDWDRSVVGVHVPKRSLLGMHPLAGPVPQGLPDRLVPGMELVDFVVSIGGDETAMLEDRLPNAGAAGPFVLGHETVAHGLRIETEPPQTGILFGPSPTGVVATFPLVPVPAGEHPIAILFRIHNDADEARRVNLSYQFRSDGPEAAWSARMVSGLELPPLDSRLVNLIVGPHRIEFGKTQLFQITARTEDGQDHVSYTVRLVSAAPQPSPERRELFFHSAREFGFFGLFYDFLQKQPIGYSVNGWMNTQSEDDRGTGDDGVVFGNGWVFDGSATPPFSWQSTGEFLLELPIDRELAVAPSGTIDFTFQIRTTAPIAGTAIVHLFAGDEFLGQGAAPYAVTTGTGDTKVEIKYAGDGFIDRGETIRLTLTLAHDMTLASPAVFYTVAPEFVPKESRLTIPFIPNTRAKEYAIPAGPAVIGLSTDDNPNAFVNPGESTLFNVTLVNEGIQPDVLRLFHSVNGTAGNVSLRPGNEFRLEPGEVAVVGLVVDAPVDAVEGSRIEIVLNATSQADDRAVNTVSFVVTVTDGVEIEDESDAFQVDERTDLRHVKAESATPGPGFVPLVVFVFVFGVLLRKKRTS